VADASLFTDVRDVVDVSHNVRQTDDRNQLPIANDLVDFREFHE
jgi:hypothetical protein